MWKAVLTQLVLLGLLFALHIVFAVMDADTAFDLVAVGVSLQIICFGPLVVVTEGASSRIQRRRTHRSTVFVSIPLAVGLGWAYAGMAWGWAEVLVCVAATIGVHFCLELALRDG